MSDVTIYALCEPDTGEVRYIGRSANPTRRLHAHVSQARQVTHRAPSAQWVRGLLAVGVGPSLRVLEIVNVDDAIMAEERAIARHRSMRCELVNAVTDGRGRLSQPGMALLDHLLTINMPLTVRDRLVAAAQADRRKVGELARVLLEDGLAAWERAHQNQGKQDGEQ